MEPKNLDKEFEIVNRRNASFNVGKYCNPTKPENYCLKSCNSFSQYKKIPDYFRET